VGYGLSSSLHIIMHISSKSISYFCIHSFYGRVTQLFRSQRGKLMSFSQIGKIPSRTYNDTTPESRVLSGILASYIYCNKISRYLLLLMYVVCAFNSVAYP